MNLVKREFEFYLKKSKLLKEDDNYKNKYDKFFATVILLNIQKKKDTN